MKTENEIVLQQAKMRMIRWMCGIRLRDKSSCVALRHSIGIEDIATVLQRNRLRWYGKILPCTTPQSAMVGLHPVIHVPNYMDHYSFTDP